MHFLCIETPHALLETLTAGAPGPQRHFGPDPGPQRQIGPDPGPLGGQGPCGGGLALLTSWKRVRHGHCVIIVCFYP